MRIQGLILDPSSNVPVVLLKHDESQVLLPIWIGVFEANAIALRIENVTTVRPMTHDLLLNTLVELGTRVEKVVISDLRESTFYALIHLQRNGESVHVDSRPSDAIALAIRAEAPIFVARPVLEKAKAVDLAADLTDEERLRKWLEEVRPEDLGKYTM